MPQCLTLGGVTTEMAIEDLDTALTALIVTLTAQGATNEEILQEIDSHITSSLKVHRATLMGIEIIADQEEGSLIDNVEEE